MKVFILQRVVWNSIDGELRTIIQVYSDHDVAHEEQQRLEFTEGTFCEFSGIDYEVEEWEVV